MRMYKSDRSGGKERGVKQNVRILLAGLVFSILFFGGMWAPALETEAGDADSTKPQNMPELLTGQAEDGAASETADSKYQVYVQVPEEWTGMRCYAYLILKKPMKMGTKKL